LPIDHVHLGIGIPESPLQEINGLDYWAMLLKLSYMRCLTLHYCGSRPEINGFIWRPQGGL
jgi:hypothetical protein